MASAVGFAAIFLGFLLARIFTFDWKETSACFEQDARYKHLQVHRTVTGVAGADECQAFCVSSDNCSHFFYEGVSADIDDNMPKNCSLGILQVPGEHTDPFDKGSVSGPAHCPGASGGNWVYVEYGTLWGVLSYFIYGFLKLTKPAPDTKKKRIERLKEAIPNAAGTGLTEAWYERVDEFLSRLKFILITVLIAYLFHAISVSYPMSPIGHMYKGFQDIWTWAHNTCHGNTKEGARLLFMITWVLFMISFWTVGGLYLILDWYRPAWAMPFKVQQEYHLNKEDLTKAVKQALLNQAIQFVVMWFMFDAFYIIAPDAFTLELPSFMDVTLGMLASAPLSEMWFYWFHILHHKSDWLWNNVHYIHHEWKAPIAIASLYTHPLEMLIVNIPTGFIGPFVLRLHLWGWWIGVLPGTTFTMFQHCGWHLPYWTSSEAHDFHHSFGTDNFGVTNVLDNIVGTVKHFEASWKSKLDKVYFHPDYPVDKVLVAPSRPAAGEDREEDSSDREEDASDDPKDEGWEITPGETAGCLG